MVVGCSCKKDNVLTIIRVRTLTRKLNDWGLRRHLPPPSVEVRARVQKLASITQNDRQLKAMLEQEGAEISIQQVAKTRRVYGIRRRTLEANAQAWQQECVDIVRELITSGRCLLYGARMMREHLRLEGHIFCRDQVLAAQKIVDPVGVDFRALTKERRRAQFVTRGPNHIWSVDGHDKLASYGIQIYGGMDVFSRLILWMYVGVSNRTAVSVNKQYLETVASRGVVPHQIRSDKGKETLQMACSQVLLRRAVLPPGGATFDFRSAYLYGTSKKNQRIEAWWRQMSERVTADWVERFKTLEELSKCIFSTMACFCSQWF